MARYTDSVCKLCRNEGEKLFLKGSRCYTTKCAIERRRYPSGPHGQERKKQSEYALQLREKNKLRRTFGMLEGPFALYMQEAQRQKKVPTGLRLLQLLESRLDNIVHRSGLVPSRAQARQLILHGHILVDGKKVTVASFMLKPGQVASVAEKSKKLVKTINEASPSVGAPPWISVDLEISPPPSPTCLYVKIWSATIKEALIVEYYSR